MRKKIVAGNWKMNKDFDEGIVLANEVAGMAKSVTSKGVELILCPPFIHLKRITEIALGSGISTSAQNCSSEVSGAFTGEISASMIKSTGVEYVIIGHSERRIIFGEDDNTLLLKTITALREGLKVIFCCGELLPEREAGVHYDIINGQLENTIFKLTTEEFGNIVVAYEPVWAIGTGVTASQAQAQEMHAYIRSLIKTKFGRAIAESTSLLYGGSCKPSNAAELFASEDVDGGLIGGASLNASDFIKIADSF